MYSIQVHEVISLTGAVIEAVELADYLCVVRLDQHRSITCENRIVMNGYVFEIGEGGLDMDDVDALRACEGHRIASVAVDQGTDLRLTLSNGVSLGFLGNTEAFEAYQVELPGGTIVV